MPDDLVSALATYADLSDSVALENLYFSLAPRETLANPTLPRVRFELRLGVGSDRLDPAALAALDRHPLSPRAIDHVIALADDATVLYDLAGSQVLSDTQLDALFERATTRRFALAPVTMRSLGARGLAEAPRLAAYADALVEMRAHRALAALLASTRPGQVNAVFDQWLLDESTHDDLSDADAAAVVYARPDRLGDLTLFATGALANAVAQSAHLSDPADQRRLLRLEEIASPAAVKRAPVLALFLENPLSCPAVVDDLERALVAASAPALTWVIDRLDLHRAQRDSGRLIYVDRPYRDLRAKRLMAAVTYLLRQHARYSTTRERERRLIEDHAAVLAENPALRCEVRDELARLGAARRPSRATAEAALRAALPQRHPLSPTGLDHYLDTPMPLHHLVGRGRIDYATPTVSRHVVAVAQALGPHPDAHRVVHVLYADSELSPRDLVDTALALVGDPVSA